MASFTYAALILAASLALHADAHSYMIEPMPTWPVSWATNNFAATTAGQTAQHWTAFNKSTYTSLKDLVDKTAKVETLSPFGMATLECGFSLANGTARDLPSEYVEWNQLTEGHDGPCEVWCDDVLAFGDDNCAVNYPETPSKWPFDVYKCSGASRLTAYWIALHGLPWQVFINCVPLTGSVNSTTVDTTTTTLAPVSTTAPTDSSYADEAEGSECGSLDIAGSGESDCGSLDVAGSDESSCGSLDVAGDDTDTSTTEPNEVAGDADTVDSECGSLDIAEDSECGSLDIAEESDCGSLDIAEGAESDEQYTGSTTGIDFSTLQGASTAGTVTPQK
ncbi:hypothetical protein GN244_ATG11499 [Phytophthora infestans]|uniref:Uncharacterized protein n=1 Tax=Phytophthora infestans TaxID=4787 RepID=A0A833T3W4_PHYIN|nr:hypothetical protein GN244_ATG11499 [Phytophthora infestans]KAF4146135.1 hypothetical protein GN958_ATG04610 [Phytophthora infestans]